MSTKIRALYGLVATVPLLLSLLVYFGYIYMLGFPDGFISEQQRAQRLLAYVFIAISFCASSGLFYLAAVADERSKHWRFLLVTTVYLVCVAITFWVNHFHLARLMGSGGG